MSGAVGKPAATAERLECQRLAVDDEQSLCEAPGGSRPSCSSSFPEDCGVGYIAPAAFRNDGHAKERTPSFARIGPNQVERSTLAESGMEPTPVEVGPSVPKLRASLANLAPNRSNLSEFDRCCTDIGQISVPNSTRCVPDFSQFQ